MQLIREIAVTDVPCQRGLCLVPENKIILVPVRSSGNYAHPCYLSVGPQADGGWGHLLALDVGLCELNGEEYFTRSEFMSRLHTTLVSIQMLSDISGVSNNPLQVLIPRSDRWMYLPDALGTVIKAGESLALRLLLER